MNSSAIRKAISALPFSALSAGALRTGIAGWLPLLAALLLFSVNTFYYFLAGTAFRFQAVLFFFLLLFSMGAAVWFFGIAAKFEAAAGETLRLALLLAVRNPGWTLFFILLQAAALFVCWFFVYLPLLFGAGLIAYVQQQPSTTFLNGYWKTEQSIDIRIGAADAGRIRYE